MWARIEPLTDERAISLRNGFIGILHESKRKLNEWWVDKGRQFYKNLMQKWLVDNDVLMYSTNNKGKSVVDERFIKTLKCKIYKVMTANDNKSYLSYFNKSVDYYDNSYHCSAEKNKWCSC